MKAHKLHLAHHKILTNRPQNGKQTSHNKRGNKERKPGTGVERQRRVILKGRKPTKPS